MNFDALAAFGVFAERLNFTHSAKALGISQPALHTKIRKLGEELQVVLYTKHGRELRLTADGEEVARFAREVESRTSEFEGRLSGVHRRPLVFGAGRGAHLHLLGGAVRRYLRRYQELSLPIMNSAEVIGGVMSGQVDLGISTESPDQDLLESRVVRRVRQVVVMPKGHSLAGRARLKPHDLEALDLVVPPPGRGHRAHIERVMSQAGARWRDAVHADGWDLMLHFVSEGMGLAIVNDFIRVPTGLKAVSISGFDDIVYRLIWKRSMRSERLEHLVEQVLARQT